MILNGMFCALIIFLHIMCYTLIYADTYSFNSFSKLSHRKSLYEYRNLHVLPHWAATVRIITAVHHWLLGCLARSFITPVTNLYTDMFTNFIKYRQNTPQGICTNLQSYDCFSTYCSHQMLVLVHCNIFY